MRIRRPVAIVIVVITVGASAIRTQTQTSVPADLQSAITAREKAMDNGDLVTWERYTTDNFMSVNTDGTVGHKDAGPERDRVIANQRRDAGPPTRIQESLRLYGDSTAIQVLRVTPPIVNARSNRVTGVWIREGGVWKVASSHGSTVQK